MRPTDAATIPHADLGRPTAGRRFEVGDGFSALSFGRDQFGDRMDPLVMVDHFTMNTPTFGVHPHAGISAVSVLFEDTEGRFHNRDSLGHDFDLEPGDLYWLRAGSGIVHDERPRPGARIHGLQIFVNLSAAEKFDAPGSRLVRAAEVPVLTGDGARVRVVLGTSNGVSGPPPAAPSGSAATSLTILDTHLDAGGRFTHSMPADERAWVLAVDGAGAIEVDGAVVPLVAGEAVTIHPDHPGCDSSTLTLHSEAGVHLVVLQGRPIGEAIAQRGGFVMNTEAELDAVEAAHAAGEFGSL